MLSRDWVERKTYDSLLLFEGLRIAIHRECEFETLLAKYLLVEPVYLISSFYFGIGLILIGFYHLKSIYPLLKLIRTISRESQ